MGVLDFFKSKRVGRPTDSGKTVLVDKNNYLLNTLKNRLIALGYNAGKHPDYLALRLNDGVEISTVISENPANHASILQLMILTSHPKYFPDGIFECIVGLGVTIEDQIQSVLDNYLNTTFGPIMAAFTERHDPTLDFLVLNDGKASLWHPRPGRIGFQGQWLKYPEGEPFFDLLKEQVKGKLTSNKFNWLKIYASKDKNGTLICECNFNNTPWEEGKNSIDQYAGSWDINGDFQGMKQFLMFRRCDASDDQAAK